MCQNRFWLERITFPYAQDYWLLFVKANEREIRQSETGCLSPLHVSVRRQLRHLPGGLDVTRSILFNLALLGVDRLVSKRETVWVVCSQTTQRKVECKRLNHAKEFWTTGGFLSEKMRMLSLHWTALWNLKKNTPTGRDGLCYRTDYMWDFVLRPLESE